MSIELYSQSQTKLSAGCDTFDATAYFESYYMNSMQIQVMFWILTISLLKVLVLLVRLKVSWDRVLSG